MHNFDTVEILGKGVYSSVYKVRRVIDNIEYAMKKVSLFNLNEKEKENALNEIRILASINHPWVISYKEAFIDEPTQTLWIVMEYANDGDLFQKISKLK